jgi:hypothetical protein
MAEISWARVPATLVNGAVVAVGCVVLDVAAGAGPANRPTLTSDAAATRAAEKARR